MHAFHQYVYLFHQSLYQLLELAKEELNESKKRVEELENELKILLLPKDPNDDKDIIVEIRAGAGGDEAALFAAELFRMYTHYVESRGWKIEVVNADETGIGGMKEVEFMVKGQGAYSVMKYESGVHRVQRVPETESGGRIHTSTASVAVMPEAEEVDIKIDEKEKLIMDLENSNSFKQTHSIISELKKIKNWTLEEKMPGLEKVRERREKETTALVSH